MTDLTPDQICEQLVKAGKLTKHTDDFGRHRYWLTERVEHGITFTAEQAIVDGNVAMAAWAAVKDALGDCKLILEHWPSHDQTQIVDLRLIHLGKVSSPSWGSFESSGTIAITTACALALKAMEEG